MRLLIKRKPAPEAIAGGYRAMLDRYQPKRLWGCVVFGLLLVGAFATVVLAYMFTEYLLTRLDVRRRVLVGDGSPLAPILYANGVSFLVVGISSSSCCSRSDIGLYAAYAVLALPVRTGRLARQHLWFYYRDHLRLGYNRETLSPPCEAPA